jgi:small subunit ribosomal protein S2
MNDILENQKQSDVALTVADEEIQAMVKAGMHIGHVPSKTHPKMIQHIYANRNGVAVFDLVKTKEKLQQAENFLRKIISEGKTVLFVGTKPAARRFIRKLGDTYGVPIIVERWIGGTLTNSKVILGRVQELERLLKEKAEGGFKKYTKKEAMKKEDVIRHLEKTFGGLRKLKRMPDAVFLADIDEDELAVREANRMHVPVVGVTNSHTNPASITYPIPANDNSIPALEYLFERLEKVIEEARKEIKVTEA